MNYEPRGLALDQFNVGGVFACQSRTVTKAYALLSTNPVISPVQCIYVDGGDTLEV
jgi:hypothetical protein